VSATAALTLAVLAVLSGSALWASSMREHAIFLALAAGPMVLGHGLLNWSLRYVPAIAALQKKYEAVRESEMAKAQKKALKDLGDKERQAVDVVTKGIINKLLHGPMSYLRSDDNDGTKASVQQIEQIFMLGESEGSQGRR
jgi:hypothetical protein